MALRGIALPSSGGLRDLGKGLSGFLHKSLSHLDANLPCVGRMIASRKAEPNKTTVTTWTGWSA